MGRDAVDEAVVEGEERPPLHREEFDGGLTLRTSSLFPKVPLLQGVDIVTEAVG